MSINFKVVVEDDWLGLVEECIERMDRPNHHTKGLVNDFESGKWRINRFCRFIFSNVLETALTRKERDSLGFDYGEGIARAIKRLRIYKTQKYGDDSNSEHRDRGKGGELAEIVLYGILRKYYGVLPVVPKIFYKQDKSTYALGADSVHIQVNKEDGNFSIWYGEAKFYRDFNQAIKMAASSVNTLLSDDSLLKENSIVTSLDELRLAVDNDVLYDSIVNFLNEETSLDIIKKKLHVPILLLYECNITQDATSMTEEYIVKMKEDFSNKASQYFDEQKIKCAEVFGYDGIHFHLILLPIPSKDDIVDGFGDVINVIAANL